MTSTSKQVIQPRSLPVCSQPHRHRVPSHASIAGTSSFQPVHCAPPQERAGAEAHLAAKRAHPLVFESGRPLLPPRLLQAFEEPDHRLGDLSASSFSDRVFISPLTKHIQPLLAPGLIRMRSAQLRGVGSRSGCARDSFGRRHEPPERWLGERAAGRCAAREQTMLALQPPLLYRRPRLPAPLPLRISSRLCSRNSCFSYAVPAAVNVLERNAEKNCCLPDPSRPLPTTPSLNSQGIANPGASALAAGPPHHFLLPPTIVHSTGRHRLPLPLSHTPSIRSRPLRWKVT